VQWIAANGMKQQRPNRGSKPSKTRRFGARMSAKKRSGKKRSGK
jgi:hypothetical protein